MKRSSSVILAGLFAIAGGPLWGDSHGTAPHWGYQGETGPEHWGELAREYASCGSGRSQSPVDLVATEQAGMNAIEFGYHPAPLEMLNNGHTLRVNYAEGSTISLVGREYRLVEFHFHTPSEHLIGGGDYPAEIHLVHRNPEGSLAVIGVLVEQGQFNPALVKLQAHLPQQAGEALAPEGVVIDAAALLPEDHRYYRYMGSLTTPPCSEGVNWLVMKQPIQLSADQIAALQAIMGENARPAQPRNGRSLLDATVLN